MFVLSAPTVPANPALGDNIHIERYNERIYYYS